MPGAFSAAVAVDDADAERAGRTRSPFGTDAVCMIAPLTWSGVQPGFLASSVAAMPETTGAANEVPDIHM